MSSEHPTLRDSLKALPPSAWILFAGTFINRFGAFVVVFLILYLTDAGYSATQAGLAVSAYGIGAFGAAPIGGYLADLLGRRNTIALSMFSAGAAMLMLSQVTTFPLVVLFSALTGFTAELYRPASSALLTDLTQLGQRVSAFAMYRLAINLGAAVGPAVGGLVAERSFFLIFLGDAITSAVFGIVALLALPNHDRRPHETKRGAGSVRTMLADRAFLLFLVANVFSVLAYVQSHSTFALQVTVRGFSNAAYGGLLSLNGLLVMLIELPITSITQRLRPRRVMSLGFLLIGIGFGLTTVAYSVPFLALTVVIWTLGEIVSMPVASAYVADAAPADMRGRYQGAFGATFGVGLIFGPSLGTLVFSRSPTSLWLGCFVLGSLAALLVLAGSGWRAKARGDTVRESPNH